ncbi:MAG: hypothetical protein ABI718_01800 [Acidobacteriota bacterium]
MRIIRKHLSRTGEHALALYLSLPLLGWLLPGRLDPEGKFFDGIVTRIWDFTRVALDTLSIPPG